MHANFDRLIQLNHNEIFNIRVLGDITPLITYEVLYVGQCVNQHIFSRFKAHHALQKILIKEQIIPKDYDKVNDLLLLPGIVKKCAVREYPKSVMDRYQAAW